MRQLAFALARPPAPLFENFVAGRNAEVLACLRSLPDARASERFVYLWGPPASGRTHLLKATVAAFGSAGASARYAPCAGGGSFDTAEQGFECVAVDDVNGLGDAAQVSLFHLYNALRERGAALVASGDAPPARLALRPDVVTRLGWGFVYRLQPLTDAEKAQALVAHAEARGFALSREMCEYLLRRVRRDMPTLLAVLDALDRHSLEAKRAVTLPLLRDLLRRGERDREA
jgi:DnaA family protein